MVLLKEVLFFTTFSYYRDLGLRQGFKIFFFFDRMFFGLIFFILLFSLFQASHTHDAITEAAQLMKEAVDDIMVTLNEAASEVGMVGGMVDSITEAMSKVSRAEQRMVFLGTRSIFAVQEILLIHFSMWQLTWKNRQSRDCFRSNTNCEISMSIGWCS